MSLRRIDVSEEKPIARPDPGPLPELVWLDVAALVVDDSYQRPLTRHNWTAIRKIAREFTWSRFIPVEAAPLGDGRYAVIDGQHRAHAAALAGQGRVPAIVVEIPVEAQAAAFAAINTQRTGVSRFHLLRAALTAGEDWAVRAMSVCEGAGCRLMMSNRSAAMRAPRDLYTPALIEKLIRGGADEALSRALRALSGAPCGDHVRVWQDRVLNPWITAAMASELPEADLSAFLVRTNLDILADKAAALRSRPDFAHQTARALILHAFELRLKQFAAQPGEAA